MNPISIANRSKDFTFSCINIGSRLLYVKEQFTYRKIIERNEKFRDIHKGQTCFILGNGPSIRELDCSLLEGKYVFTVNAMLNQEQFKKLKPKYHCIADRQVYKKLKENVINAVQENESTAFFFHRSIYRDIGTADNAYYTYATLLPTNQNIKVDITKNANVFINVVPYSIMIAIYMGFKKIVLLGCDFSFFASRKDAHFYETGKGVKREESLFQDLFGSAIACQQYAYLYEYAKKHDISILNATNGSLLDVIPQVDLNTVL